MKKQLINEAFRLQQLAGIEPVGNLKEEEFRPFDIPAKARPEKDAINSFLKKFITGAENGEQDLDVKLKDEFEKMSPRAQDMAMQLIDYLDLMDHVGSLKAANMDESKLAENSITVFTPDEWEYDLFRFEETGDGVEVYDLDDEEEHLGGTIKGKDLNSVMSDLVSKGILEKEDDGTYYGGPNLEDNNAESIVDMYQ